MTPGRPTKHLGVFRGRHHLVELHSSAFGLFEHRNRCRIGNVQRRTVKVVFATTQTVDPIGIQEKQADGRLNAATIERPLQIAIPKSEQRQRTQNIEGNFLVGHELDKKKHHFMQALPGKQRHIA